MTSQKKVLLIMLHEIYGVNEHIEGMAETFRAQGFDVLCPNLIARLDPFMYEEEALAYESFMRDVGFDVGLQQIEQLVDHVRMAYEKIVVVGFSVGATIAWRMSERPVDAVVGFYGSRIRDYEFVTPKCPTLLFFPQQEASFNVLVLAEKLEKPFVHVEICEAKHGFTNPQANTYDAKCTAHALKQTMTFLQESLVKL